MVEIKFFRIDDSVLPPSRAYPSDDPPDAGFDLASRVEVTLDPGERAVVPTGIYMALPRGYAGFIHSRSGLAAQHGITVLDAPSIIDPNFRGELTAILINHDRTESFRVEPGDRVAQLVVQGVEQSVQFEEVDRRAELPRTERGEKGLGSSGTSSFDEDQ